MIVQHFGTNSLSPQADSQADVCVSHLPTRRIAPGDGMDHALKAFTADNPGAAVFTRGTTAAHVMLAVAPHRLVFAIKGAINNEDLVAILSEMRAAGHLASDDFCALIDLTGFTGAIDWDEIKKISNIMPQGSSSTNKNAYVAHDSFLAMVAKITSVLFPKTECAAFTTKKQARHWLGWA
jgi:hypothetical protein